MTPQASELWLAVRLSYPEMYRSVQTMNVARILLIREQHVINDLHQLGMLDLIDHQRLSAELASATIALARRE